MKRAKFSVLFLSLMLALTGAGSVTALAGQSNRNVATNASFAGSIDTGYWYVEGGVVSSGNALVFDSRSGDSIFSKQYAADLADYGVASVLDADLRMQIDALPEGAVFSVRFGTEMFSLSGGLADSGEIAFTGTADSGISVSVNAYDASAQKTVLYTGTSDYVAVGEEFALTASVRTGGKLALSFGDGTSETPFWTNAEEDSVFDAVGYFGFSKAASATNVKVTIKSATVNAYAYDNPSNPVEVTETFDNNSFNKEAWFAMCTPTAGQYEGGSMLLENDQLLIDNAGEALISTRQEYSNFELTFDITDMHRTAEYDDKGNVINPVSGWIGIAFGSAAHDSSFYDAVRASTFFQFEPTTMTDYEPITAGRYILWDNYVALSADVPFAEGYNIWNEEDVKGEDGQPRTVNLKFTMIDGVFSCWTKYEDEEEFSETPQFSYDMGYTPLGYVRVLAYGGITGAYCAIDNLKIVNRDYNAEAYKTEIGYTSNVVEYDPFEYTDTWQDEDLLADGTYQSEGGCGGSIAASAAGAAAALMGAAALIAARKKSKGGNRK